MQSRRDFTIEEARRSRISEGTRAGYASGINQIVIWAQRNGESRLLMPSPDYADKSTLDLSIFSYWDFLDFLQWTVRNKPTITAQTLSGYRSALKSLYKDQKVSPSSSPKPNKKTIKDPKHCYANPFKPSVSKSLLKIYFLVLDKSKSLAKMLGGNAYKNSKSEKREIGTHSIRKGVATYACSGTTGGPSIVSVCLRSW
ncbi:hypothetical protein Ae201684P_013468 [Aphanomyces euteiches]|nr:hypothetical protein Ae201684P_013468 [Aphanomyces euteiches]